MVRKVSRKEYAPSKSIDFVKVSKNFAEGAEVAVDYEYYNAPGVLIIHAAIAIADAVTIKLSSAKCSGDSHYEIIKLISETAPKNKATVTALNHFEKLIDHKNIVSYHGELYTKKDIAILMKHFDRFSIWAYGLLQVA